MHKKAIHIHILSLAPASPIRIGGVEYARMGFTCDTNISTPARPTTYLAVPTQDEWNIIYRAYFLAMDRGLHLTLMVTPPNNPNGLIHTFKSLRGVCFLSRGKYTKLPLRALSAPIVPKEKPSLATGINPTPSTFLSLHGECNPAELLAFMALPRHKRIAVIKKLQKNTQ